jgi:hypothetical protein
MQSIRKKEAKLLTMLVVLTMIFSLFPAAGVFAADAENVIIRVIGLDESGDSEYWVEPTEITVPDGGISSGGVLGLDKNYTGMSDATVLNAVHYVASNWNALKASGIGALGACKTQIGADGLRAYIEEFHDLGEFDEGLNSGWMFFVNDEFAGESLGEYELEDYDVVTLFYVKDYATAMYTYFDKATLTMTNNKIVAQTESGDGAEVPLKVMAQSLNFSDLYAVKLNMSSGASLYEAGGTLSGSVDYNQGYVLADINESISTSTAAGVKAAYSGAVQYIPAYYPFATADYQYDTLNDADTARDAIVAAHSTAYPSANYESGSYAILTDAYTELYGASTIPTIIGALQYYNRAAADLIGKNDAKINRLGIATYGLTFDQAVSPTTYAYTFNNGADPDEHFTLGFINPGTTYTATATEGSFTVSQAGNVVSASDMAAGDEYVITIATSVNGGAGTASYTITIDKSSSSFGSPTAVKAYLPAPGQYITGTGWGSISTDNANSLTNPDVVKLLGTPTGEGVSLGGFGGYVVCYYADGITDDPNNQFGIDFIVYGNAFTNWCEPGIVMVATGKTENGQIVPDKWYYIAGSEHYNNAAWDNDIVYTKNGTTNITYSLNGGASTPWATGIGWWPLYLPKASGGENYGETSHTEFVSGVTYPDPPNHDTILGINDHLVRLPDNVYYQFGYCDVHPNGSNFGEQANPYTATTATAYGDGIDLAWAVEWDADREIYKPVDMSEKVIKFVKIYTGDLGISMGEDSTEVLGIKKATLTGSSSAVGPTALTVGGVNHLSDLTVGAIPTTPILILEDTPTTVSVTATSGYTVFVNNAKGTTTASQSYTLADGEQQVVRVIVQNGTAQPYIAYLLLQGVSS